MTAEPTGVATMWQVRDRLGRIVSLTKEGWRHIVEDRRGVVPTVDEVRAAVETPDVVTADKTYAPRENSYRRSAPDRPYLKVVVHFRPVAPGSDIGAAESEWVGVVITAYPTIAVPRKEPQLWP